MEDSSLLSNQESSFPAFVPPGVHRAPTFKVMAPGMITEEVTLQTFQLIVFAVGHATKLRPPVAPHPVAADGSEANAVVNVLVSPRPLIVAAAAIVQVLGEIGSVGRTIWILVIEGIDADMTSALSGLEKVASPRLKLLLAVRILIGQLVPSARQTCRPPTERLENAAAGAVIGAKLITLS